MKAYVFEDIREGLTESFSIHISQQTVDTFIALTGDDNPLHTDASYCSKLGIPQTVVHGCLTASFVSTLVGKYLPGKNSRLLSLSISWPRPVFVEDDLLIEGVVDSLSPSIKTLDIKLKITNQSGQTVAKGKVLAECLK